MPRVTLHIPGLAPQPYRFSVDREVLTMGRGPDNDIVIDSGSVSVLHSEIQRVPGGYQLRDLESTNGITLDGYRESVIDLRPGLDIKLGEVTLEYAFAEGDAEVFIMEIEQPRPLPITQRLYPDTRQYQEPEVEIIEVEASNGAGRFLLVAVLVFAAFAGGLAWRFQKETGASWIDAVQAHFSEGSPAQK